MWRLGKSRRWPGDFKRIPPYSRDRPDVGLRGPVSALTPCQIREKLSPPINFSVSFSHPCCAPGLGSWMRPTAASSPPTSSDVHQDSLLWVRDSGPGPWHPNNTSENNAHSRLTWRVAQAGHHGKHFHTTFHSFQRGPYTVGFNSMIPIVQVGKLRQGLTILREPEVKNHIA